MNFSKENATNQELINIYKNLLIPRLLEEKMLILLRQGKISKWFSGIGQEAISVGTTMALEADEFILPMHRNLGMFTTRRIPFSKLFAQWMGKPAGFTKGRDRSFHFGSIEHHIIGMISHLGPQMGVADGIGLGQKLKKNNKVTLVITGDGGTSEGDFHEALNVAAVWDLPVIFLVESNGYGLSTPSNQQFRCQKIADKAIGYGIETSTIDGNNILEVYNTVKSIAKNMRKKNAPFLLVCDTFRMRGHEEASGTKYIPQMLFTKWGAKDPIKNYEHWLIAEAIISESTLQSIYKEIKQAISKELAKATVLPNVEADFNQELKDCYATFQYTAQVPQSETKNIRFVDAIANGLDKAMEKHKNLILMGQDIAEYGGVFKVTENLQDKYGKQRVRNTPLCESAILSAALGLSIAGYKSMVEMQFADFVSSGFTAVINNIAKTHYRWQQNADVVIRMPTGAGVGAGPFHSQSNEAWFFHTPGLKIAYPATPEDAKGLLLTAFEDPNPVLFFEHKALYRSIRGEVPESYYNIPFGKAKYISNGNDCSIITYGMGVHWAKTLLDKYTDLIEIIDLRTLAPLDWETVFESVKKTGKCLVLHEDTLTGGIGGELSAKITETCFQFLDAPVVRVGSLDTPVPFAANLEESFLANSQLANKLEQLLAY